MTERVVFNVDFNGTHHQVTEEHLRNTEQFYGLKALAAGRYSWLFVLDMYLLEHFQGVDPFPIVDEIRHLENPRFPSRTKPAAEFKYPPLKGLWHKHYFSAR